MGMTSANGDEEKIMDDKDYTTNIINGLPKSRQVYERLMEKIK